MCKDGKVCFELPPMTEAEQAEIYKHIIDLLAKEKAEQGDQKRFKIEYFIE